MFSLNLGSGKVRIPGFVNIDMNPDNEPDIIGDAGDLIGDSFKLGKFRSNPALEDFSNKPWDIVRKIRIGEVQDIIAYDIIEHFDRVEIPLVLKNWFDHMVPGGRMYIRTNDLDSMIRLYRDDPVTFPAEKFIWHLMCEHETPGMGHKWCFTRKTLFQALIGAGFTKVEITPEENVRAGDYFHSNTKCDLCNVHMIATKG